MYQPPCTNRNFRNFGLNGKRPLSVYLSDIMLLAWQLGYENTIVLLISYGEGKRRMSLRNGMWHALRNDIIMRNVIYAEIKKRNK